MRRLCVILLACLVAVPAALAGTAATGDGVLEVSQAAGTVIVNGTRGTLWGQMAKGKLVVTDPIPGDGQVFVSGWDTRRPGVNDNVMVYTGADIHFRVSGGKYRLFFKGSGIDFTAVGVGTAQLIGDIWADDPGKYALDGGKWIPVPLPAPFGSPRPVQFGVQPTPVGGPAPTP